ncbi:hypothetical protein VTJ04DRAFT_9707 [Mycothermus thermophilus]|uniref:uncharacterized protein n=1 Tax=Humicola insolens TaxID=85995 RepID=UPI0037427DEB
MSTGYSLWERTMSASARNSEGAKPQQTRGSMLCSIKRGRSNWPALAQELQARRDDCGGRWAYEDGDGDGDCGRGDGGATGSGHSRMAGGDGGWVSRWIAAAVKNRGPAAKRRRERSGNYREEKGGSASKAKRRNNTARLVMVHTFVVAFPFPFPLFVGVWRSAHSWTRRVVHSSRPRHTATIVSRRRRP